MTPKIIDERGEGCYITFWKRLRHSKCPGAFGP